MRQRSKLALDCVARSLFDGEDESRELVLATLGAKVKNPAARHVFGLASTKRGTGVRVNESRLAGARAIVQSVQRPGVLGMTTAAAVKHCWQAMRAQRHEKLFSLV